MNGIRNLVGLVAAAVALAAPASALAFTPGFASPLASPAAKARTVGDSGLVLVGGVGCAASSCQLRLPRQVLVAIDGERFWAKVFALRSLDRGDTSRLRIKLPAAALARLDGRSTRVRVRVVVDSDQRTLVRVVTVRIRRAAGQTGGPEKGPAAPGPQSGPIVSEVPTLARPATAVDVSDVHVSWFPRDSWVRYASSSVAAGDGIKTGNGAVGVKSKASPCPDRPSSSDAELPYQVDFAAKPSWYDPVSGSAGVYGQGSVAFKWAAHTIDLTASDPEIEIAGAASRAIFRFSGSGGTPYPNQRASLVSLDTAGRPAVSNGGKTFTYSLMRGTLTADGVNVFAGFYTPPDNDEFGCVSVSFTTP